MGGIGGLAFGDASEVSGFLILNCGDFEWISLNSAGFGLSGLQGTMPGSFFMDFF